MGLIGWFKRLFGMTPAKPGEVAASPKSGVSYPTARPGPARLTAAEVLTRTRDLLARNAQWPDVWGGLNPTADAAVEQLLLELRNDGLQFAPWDGLRRIELACEALATDPTADAVAVLRQVLGKTDVLDTFR